MKGEPLATTALLGSARINVGGGAVEAAALVTDDKRFLEEKHPHVVLAFHGSVPHPTWERELQPVCMGISNLCIYDDALARIEPCQSSAESA